MLHRRDYDTLWTRLKFNVLLRSKLDIANTRKNIVDTCLKYLLAILYRQQTQSFKKLSFYIKELS